MLADQVKQLVAKNQELEFVSKAEREFPHVPGASIELAKTLKAAHDAGPEAEKVILAALKGVEELTSKSAMLQEIGTSGGGTTAGGAYSKIEALAAGLTMKSENGKELTKEQKVNYVISKTAEGRSLYEQYNEERRQLQKRI